MSPEHIKKILDSISSLPGTAVVPVGVAAAHDSVSVKTVRRRYPLVQLSPYRQGVTVEYLRSRRAAPAA